MPVFHFFSRSVTESSWLAAATRSWPRHDPTTHLQSNASKKCCTPRLWTVLVRALPACPALQLLPAWPNTHFLLVSSGSTIVDQACDGKSSTPHPSSFGHPQPWPQDAPYTANTTPSCCVFEYLLSKPAATTGLAVQHDPPANLSTKFHERTSTRSFRQSCDPSYKFITAAATTIVSLQLGATCPHVPQYRTAPRPEDASHLCTWIHPARSKFHSALQWKKWLNICELQRSF